MTQIHNLVTGAAGHIGNVLTRTLLARGQKVRALLLPNESRAPLAGLDVDVVEGDVLQPESLRRAMHGIQRVYHLAAIVSIMPGKDDHVHAVNVDGTRNVIRAARHSGIQRLIYTSSIHAFQRVPHGITIDESIPFDPQHAISAYDQSKAEASLLVEDAAHAGLDAVIACPTGVIGPYDFRRSAMGQVILSAMRERVQFLVRGSAYDFVDVRDAAEGLALAAENGKTGERYLLAGQRITFGELLTYVEQVTHMRHIRLTVPAPLILPSAHLAPFFYRLTNSTPRLTPYAIETVLSNSVISSEKARRELGYAPRSLQTAIHDTVQWFIQNP